MLRRAGAVVARSGDASLAAERLDWKATTQWDELARHMVEADVQALEDELAGRQVRVDR